MGASEEVILPVISRGAVTRLSHFRGCERDADAAGVAILGAVVVSGLGG